MKVFGKALFEKKKVKIEELYDFAQHGLISNDRFVTIENLQIMVEETPAETVARKKAAAKKPKPKVITPKGLHQLNTLNIPKMQFNCTPEYVKEQSELLERKAGLIVKGDEYGGAVKYGKKELLSLVERMNNREYYEDYKEFFDQYPYTTSAQIHEVVSGYSNLKTCRVEQFVPDLPKEAIDAMTEYNENTKEICGKTAVFYIIADKKDFEKQTQKRDPILLAQSPFGLVWQIIGAWDEEMVLLEEL